jgi:hypothetical protein
MVTNGLSAVEPNGGSVVNCDGEGCGGWRRRGGNKAGEKSTRGERMARVGKARLSDGVVLCMLDAMHLYRS